MGGCTGGGGCDGARFLRKCDGQRGCGCAPGDQLGGRDPEEPVGERGRYRPPRRHRQGCRGYRGPRRLHLDLLQYRGRHGGFRRRCGREVCREYDHHRERRREERERAADGGGTRGGRAAFRAQRAGAGVLGRV